MRTKVDSSKSIPHDGDIKVSFFISVTLLLTYGNSKPRQIEKICNLSLRPGVYFRKLF